MLLHLRIRNVAIIEESAFDLGEGFHVFTGETGAGKSILIDSLLLALGERASADLLRTGTPEAEISALFSITGMPHLEAHFSQAGIPVEDGELLLRRVISANGRSRAYINDRPVTAKFLRESGQQLVEISGQHEQQHLMQPRYHLDQLDSYGNLWEHRKKLQTQYSNVQQIRRQLNELGGDAQRRQMRRDYLLYQIEELDNVDLDLNEDDLAHRRRYLMQLEQMMEASQNAEATLYSGQHSTMEQIGRVQQRLSGWQELSEELSSVLTGLAEAEALLDDAARTLRGFVSSTDTDPHELEELEEQLSLLRDLKRKHMAQSVIGLAERLQEYQQELDELNQREAQMQELEASYDDEIETLLDLAESLSQKRQNVACNLAKEVEAELASLGMKKATFVVQWQHSNPDAVREEEEVYDEGDEHEMEAMPVVGVEEPDAWEDSTPLPGPTGFDEIQFLLSSNPGEEPKPLHRIASGGELSRIMLALKQVVNENEPVPTCVFDEVDAGVGGSTGLTIGQKIHGIGRKRQVICITHLAQIASLADRHYLIQKQEEDGRTHSRIRPLSAKEREKEVARMLGGVASEQSLAHARELLEASNEEPSIAQASNAKHKSKPSPKKQSKPKNSTPRARRTRKPQGNNVSLMASP